MTRTHQPGCRTFPQKECARFPAFRSLRAICASVLLLFLFGCAARRTQPIVFGLYDVPQHALRDVKEAGFDLVTGGSSTGRKQYLDAAREAQLGVLLTSGAFSSNSIRTSRDFDLLDRHPATWGWYLIDEPDLHDVPPGHVRKVTRDFQRRARKPGVLVLASGSAAKDYGDDCDLLMVDFYPVPWAPISRFSKEMRLADFARGEKPFFGVVQAFDWTHFSDVLGQTNGLRPPAIAEVRCMSYIALAQEARGLFFYTYAARGWKLHETELWPELKQLLKELRRFSSLFANSPVWYPTEVEYADPARMYNEVHDGVMLARLYLLKHEVNGLRPGFYFLIVNTTGNEVGFDLRLPFSDGSVMHQTGAREMFPLADRWLRRTYAPYEVSIIGPLQQPDF